MQEAKSLGIAIVWDAVLSHKTAGDSKEECWAVEVDPKGMLKFAFRRNLSPSQPILTSPLPQDRTVETTKPRKIEPWIHYSFPGRGDQYSSLKWHWQHFNGTDWDQRAERHAIYKIIDPPDANGKRRKGGKGWAPDVDDENGNFDYLMFSNIDYANAEARQDVLDWGAWMVTDVGVQGFRLDAFKHVSWHFARDWTAHVKAAAARNPNGPAADVFVLGEVWTGDVDKLVQWVDRIGHGAYTYDAPLLHHFSAASLATTDKRSAATDLRHIFKDTLVAARPNNAVTMVTSHDTAPGQMMATPIAPFFKPLSYALTLLRATGLPCVFYGDVHGTRGPYAEPPSCAGRLPALLLARRHFAYGAQTDYFDDDDKRGLRSARGSSVGWVRHGTWDRPDGCAVVMSVAGPARRGMCVGAWAAGQVWGDVMGACGGEKVVLDERGCGVFACAARSVSVWVREGAVPDEVWERACRRVERV